MKFEIIPSLCTNCGLCIKECPAKTIKRNTESSKPVIHQQNCIECSHCGMICPPGAVRVDGKELPLIPSRENLLEYEAFDRLIRSKRSVRHYKAAPLVREDLDEILYTGSISATASNTRQVSPVVLQGGEVSAAASVIAKELLKITVILKNPLLRIFTRNTPASRYTNPETVQRYSEALKKTLLGKADPLFFHAPAVVILTYPEKGKRLGRTDCALAGAHMMLTAHSRGIGSCMIGFAEAALWRKAVRKKLGISSDRRIGLVFTLGYSDRKYLRYPVRSPWQD